MATVIAFATFVSVTLLGGSIRMTDFCCRCCGVDVRDAEEGGGSAASFQTAAASEEERMIRLP
jgi:hypothetical protein